MTIDNDFLNKLAYLCRLELATHERDAMLRDLNDLVAWVEQLNGLQIDDNIVLASSFVLEEDHLRLDTVANTLTHEQALGLAPNSNTNYFQVPAVKGYIE